MVTPRRGAHSTSGRRRPIPGAHHSVSDDKPVGHSPLLEAFRSVPAGNSDDGSSPIVPILIAVAGLAALSGGIAFYRERLWTRRR